MSEEQAPLSPEELAQDEKAAAEVKACFAEWKPASDEQLKEFIEDYLAGQVYHTNMPEVLKSYREVFLCLSLMLMKWGHHFAEALANYMGEEGLIYASLNRDHTARLVVNGLPIFTSFHVLTTEELRRVRPVIEAERARRKQGLELPPKAHAQAP